MVKPRRWSANVLNFTSDPEHSWAPQPNLSWAPTSAVPTARSLPWLFVGKYICHGQIVYMYDIVWEWVMVCYGHHPYVYIYMDNHPLLWVNTPRFDHGTCEKSWDTHLQTGAVRCQLKCELKRQASRLVATAMQAIGILCPSCFQIQCPKSMG